MPCQVVLLRVDFFKMAAVAMETAKMLKKMIYFCVKFQKDLLYGVNLIFFAPWLPWQRPPV
jgi:hypothetical protein